MYATIQIKKRRYWPKNVPGDAIREYFVDKDMAHADALPGTLREEKFHIVCMKEPEYVSMQMTTFGTLQEVEGHKTRRNWTTRVGREPPVSHSKSFNYIENFSLYFKNRHQIDDHNNRQHAPISIEKTWGTKSWEHRVFAYILATSEVNVYRWRAYSDKTFCGTSQLQFRREHALQMIDNELDGSTHGDGHNLRSRDMDSGDHELVSFPKNTGKWLGNKWKKVRTDYLQRKCECSNRTRLHCKCNKASACCHSCFARHISDVLGV